MESIQLFVPTFRVEECLAQIRDCLERGWTGIGFKTNEIEEAWKVYTGLPHAHFLNSATAGLHLCFSCSRRSMRGMTATRSSRLRSPSFRPTTRFSTRICAGVRRCRRVSLPRPAVGRRTDHSPHCAIMFVGLGGNTGRLAQIADLAHERGLKLVLDAAHMAGTRIQGRHVGAEADAVVFSFQAVKNLPTADSGMICFAEAKLDEEVRKWTWLGINKDTYSRTVSQGSYKWYYDVENTGFKYHGNSIMAAIGLVSLRYLDQDNAYRRQLAAWYTEMLADHPLIGIVPVAPGCESSRHLFQIQIEHRDEVMAALNSVGVYPGVHYRDNTLYRMYADSEPCPASQLASDRLVSLPIHLRLTHAGVRHVCDSLKGIAAHMSIDKRAVAQVHGAHTNLIRPHSSRIEVRNGHGLYERS